MTWLIDQAPAFIAGWAGCCAFIAFAEWLTDVRRGFDHEPFEEAFGDHPAPCPWTLSDNKFPHRLAGVSEFIPAANKTGGGDSSGFDTLHVQSSSRLLSGGSESSL